MVKNYKFDFRVGFLSGYPIPRKDPDLGDKKFPWYPEGQKSRIQGIKIPRILHKSRKFWENPEDKKSWDSKKSRDSKKKSRIPGMKILRLKKSRIAGIKNPETQKPRPKNRDLEKIPAQSQLCLLITIRRKIEFTNILSQHQKYFFADFKTVMMKPMNLFYLLVYKIRSLYLRHYDLKDHL